MRASEPAAGWGGGLGLVDEVEKDSSGLDGIPSPHRPLNCLSSISPHSFALSKIWPFLVDFFAALLSPRRP